MQALLDPGEYVQLAARPHEVSLVAPLARAVALGGVGASLFALGLRYGWWLGAIGVGLLALAALAALVAVWRWHVTRVVVTTEKLVVVEGLARRRAAAVRLAHAGALHVEQTLLGRAFGYGTLVAGDVEIPYVPEPRRALSAPAEVTL